MARFLHTSQSVYLRKYVKMLLALLWALGLAAGAIAFACIDTDLVSLLTQAAEIQPSLGPLLVTATLPFLFSVVAVYLDSPRNLFWLCFLKAFCFAYVSCAVMTAFESAGWLIRWLLLFTDICSVAVLYCFWHRHITGVRSFSPGTAAIYQAVLCLIAGIDFSVISPLLRRCLL